jgi:CheY-specific phosphatase CheX
MIYPFIETTTSFLKNQIGLEIKSTECFGVNKVDKLQLNQVTALITIKGAIEGFFVLSMAEELLRVVSGKFLLGELTKAEEEAYLEDVLAECTNTILGKLMYYLMNY